MLTTYILPEHTFGRILIHPKPCMTFAFFEPFANTNISTMNAPGSLRKVTDARHVGIHEYLFQYSHTSVLFFPPSESTFTIARKPKLISKSSDLNCLQINKNTIETKIGELQSVPAFQMPLFKSFTEWCILWVYSINESRYKSFCT